MKTAEEIIQEYLERGYSLESLRILAESREQPLGGQMLEIIGSLEAAAPAAAPDLPAETEESALAEVACDEAVFFVADDDGAADGENVDFDLMAETMDGVPAEVPVDQETPAAAEESAADILIGGTDGAEAVAYRTEEVDAVDPAEAVEDAVAEDVSVMEDAPVEETRPERGETGMWSRLWSKMSQTTPALAPSMAEEMAAALEVAPEPVAEEEEAVFEEPVVADAEISADYIPGSEAAPFEQEEAVEPVEPVAEEIVEEEPVAEIVEEPAAEAVQADGQVVENTMSRREKRRRDRLEKKKARRGRKHAVAEQETEEPIAAETEPEPEAAADPGAATEEKPAALVAQETLDALSVRSFAFAASLLAMPQAELARAAEIIGQDRAAALAVEQNNLEAAVENGSLENDGEESVEDNVIQFRETFEDAVEDEVEESIDFEPCLRMLDAPESEESAVAEEEAEASGPSEDVIHAQEALQAALERETALRLQLEEEYQVRLDAFAAQLLDAQALAAASENRVAEKKAELDARCAVLDEMKTRLESEEAKQRELLRAIDESTAAAQAKGDELARFTREHEGLREEHGRLYKEFEDIRKAYNEVVVDVMPGLQNERDELAMTVERQCAREQTLRAGLKSSRKRLAAGYILGAAACLMLVTLPVANWLRSGDEDRKLAVDRQLFSELRETLDAQVRQNVDAQTRIVELERKITRARDEISRLDGRNKELASLAATQHSQGIAVFKPEDASASGTPTRAMTMALQATVPPGGKLHVNEVMDPAGSIEQLAMENSARRVRAGEPQMAQAPANAGAPLPISALVRTDAASGSLRPQAQGRAAARPAQAQPAPDVATVTAKVKKGEGVAQVVYRILNTRDPDVIAWVIAENKIRNDRRGNPLIQPNQELRLPKDGRIGQAASAAGANRR